jgi:hypothetical protein
MQANLKQELLDTFDRGRVALAKALAQVDETCARHQPPAGGWSILECMDHMVVSERYLLSRLRVATVHDESPVYSARAAKMAAVAADRSRHIEAPDVARPTGSFATLGEAVAAFDATRAGTIAWIEACDHDPRCLVTDHPMIPGPVTCYEILLLMAAHPGRHAKQIEEIRRQVSR